ncbi:MAG: PilZ domain-containing protein [Crocosphaera sp.]|nr:PilZ domain-containing protein [Crocosphaera sp.]
MSNSLFTEENSNQTLLSLPKRRKHHRYYDSQGSSVELIIDRQEMQQSLKGMIIDDSFTGCGLIVISEEKLYVGQLCNLKIQELDPLLCQIIWLKKLDKNLTRIGMKYLIQSKTRHP